MEVTLDADDLATMTMSEFLAKMAELLAIIGLLADQFTVSFALASVGVALILVFVLSLKSHQKQALAEVDQQQKVFEVHPTSPFRWEGRSQDSSFHIHNAQDFKTGGAVDTGKE